MKEDEAAAKSGLEAGSDFLPPKVKEEDRGLNIGAEVESCCSPNVGFFSVVAFWPAKLKFEEAGANIGWVFDGVGLSSLKNEMAAAVPKDAPGLGPYLPVLLAELFCPKRHSVFFGLDSNWVTG